MHCCSLSQGAPVLAPGGGTASEVAGDALEPVVGGDVAAAMAAVRSQPPDALREAAFSAARSASWEAMATKLVRVYRADDGSRA